MITDTLAPGPSSLASLPSSVKISDIKPSVRVVKRPASNSLGPVYNKVRLGESGQQFRIVGAGSGGGLSNILSLGGQQIKIVSQGAGVTGNLKTIVPSESPSLGSNTISLVTRDGSLTSLPVTGGSGVRIASKPQQIRILPNQPQTFKILNADGSLSDISSSIIKPTSDLKTLSSVVDSSPKKKGGTFTLKSPQKMQLIKPEAGQILKTSDGRILMGPTKKVIIPSTGNTMSPTKIVFRDPSGKTVNGSVVMRSEGGGPGSVVIRPPEAGAEEVRTGPGGGQLIRLTPEVVSSLAQGAGDAKLQFVRVVAGAGGLQSLQVKGGQVVNNIQGVRGVVTNNVKGLVVSSVFSFIQLSSFVDEAEEAKPEVKPQFVESLSKEKSRPLTNIEPQGVRPRKPCNCTKSQCLKLYCDCFANGEIHAEKEERIYDSILGEFCFNCNCNNCLNNLQNEDERQR